jgi:AMP deaminase
MFLQQVVGFDCVDDESKPDKKFTRKFPLPSAWADNTNPPYTYYLYYLWGNIKSLNRFRKARGFSTVTIYHY